MNRIAQADTQPDRPTRLTDRYLVRMLGRFIRPYWRRMVLVFALLIGVTWLSLLPPYLIQRAVDGPITAGRHERADPRSACCILCVILTTFALRFSHTYLLQTVGQNALMDLRQKLFEHLLRQDMRFFNPTPVGQLVSRLSNDIDALTELLSTSIVMVISNLMTLIGIVVVMFALNWRLALLGLAVMPVMMLITIYFRGRIRKTSANSTRSWPNTWPS